MKHEDESGRQFRGASDHQPGGSGDRAAGGTPGKRAATDRVAAADPVTTIMRGLGAAERGLQAVTAQYLPAMRAAVAGRQMPEAREAGATLSLALSRIDAELATARRWATVVESAGAVSLLAPLEAARDALRAEAAPVLALAPPPAPTLPVAAAFDFGVMTETAEAYDAGEAANREQWGAQLDAADAPAGGQVIDARDRFGADAVQRRATDAAPRDPAATHAHAQAGVAGTGGALPHQQQIQASFGAHDVSGIRAHVGGAAATASDAIGAEAYATGNDVAFATAPTLFVAAHEAAHVVQQRAGVSLLGGVGEAGDSYEQHADAVAEKVVRGESAEGLLGEGTGRSAPTAVQRKDRSSGGARAASPKSSLELDSYRKTMNAREEAVQPLLYAKLAAEQALRDESITLLILPAITDHLRQVTAEDDDLPTNGSLIEVTALVYLVLKQVERWELSDLPDAVELEAVLATLKARSPESQVREVTSEEEATQLAERYERSNSADTERALTMSVRGLQLEIDHAVDQAREQQVRKLDDPAPDLILFFYEGLRERLGHLSRTLDRNDVGANLWDSKLREAASALRDSLQRLVYWLTYDGADTVEAETIARLGHPIFMALGAPVVEVVDGAPTRTEGDGLDAQAETLKGEWHKLYEAQDLALDALMSQDEAKSQPAWEPDLFTMLATARFNATVGLVAGYVSDQAGRRVTGSASTKSAFKTATSDAIKGFAKSIFAGQAGAPSTDDPTRHSFFKRQRLAMLELRTQHEAQIDLAKLEARRSPDFRAAMEAELAATAASAVDISATYTVQAVQDWATYQAASTYGTEERTRGVDLDGVGSFDGDLEDPDHHGRGVGVMELIVDLGLENNQTRVVKAVVKGMRSDDLAHLTGQRIGDLTLPVQIRGYAAYVEMRGMFGGLGRGDGIDLAAAPVLLISRNHEGTIWLSELGEHGERWLEERGDGDAMNGAAKLFESLAATSLESVESGE